MAKYKIEEVLEKVKADGTLAENELFVIGEGAFSGMIVMDNKLANLSRYINAGGLYYLFVLKQSGFVIKAIDRYAPDDMPHNAVLDVSSAHNKAIFIGVKQALPELDKNISLDEVDLVKYKSSIFGTTFKLRLKNEKFTYLIKVKKEYREKAKALHNALVTI